MSELSAEDCVARFTPDAEEWLRAWEIANQRTFYPNTRVRRLKKFDLFAVPFSCTMLTAVYVNWLMSDGFLGAKASFFHVLLLIVAPILLLVTYSFLKERFFRQRMARTLSSLFSNDEVSVSFSNRALVWRNKDSTTSLDYEGIGEVFGLSSGLGICCGLHFGFVSFRGFSNESGYVDFVKKLKPLLSAPAIKKSAAFLDEFET